MHNVLTYSYSPPVPTLLASKVRLGWVYKSSYITGQNFRTISILFWGKWNSNTLSMTCYHVVQKWAILKLFFHLDLPDKKVSASYFHLFCRSSMRCFRFKAETWWWKNDAGEKLETRWNKPNNFEAWARLREPELSLSFTYPCRY